MTSPAPAATAHRTLASGLGFTEGPVWTRDHRLLVTSVSRGVVHEIDLARGQIGRGHKVGLVADSSTGGAHAEAVLGKLAPHLALGLMRLLPEVTSWPQPLPASTGRGGGQKSSYLPPRAGRVVRVHQIKVFQ